MAVHRLHCEATKGCLSRLAGAAWENKKIEQQLITLSSMVFEANFVYGDPGVLARPKSTRSEISTHIELHLHAGLRGVKK